MYAMSLCKQIVLNDFSIALFVLYVLKSQQGDTTFALSRALIFFNKLVISEILIFRSIDSCSLSKGYRELSVSLFLYEDWIS